MAAALRHKMRETGMIANVISFSAAISACEKGGQWATNPARSWHDCSFNAAISACEKRGQCGQASALIRKMRETGMTVDVISVRAGMTAKVISLSLIHI